MPVRHEDDFQRRPIASWDSWVEQAIQEAEERGEFDYLPDRGKRIVLEDTPFAPEMASALRTLKNAGYEPTWMELDKEITRGKRALEEFLEHSSVYLQNQIRESSPSSPSPISVSGESHWWSRIVGWLLHGDGGVTAPSRIAPLSFSDVERIRDRMRDQYLERAAALDRQIGTFHAALPRDLWRLERTRLTPEMAATRFDERCPPIL